MLSAQTMRKASLSIWNPSSKKQKLLRRTKHSAGASYFIYYITLKKEPISTEAETGLVARKGFEPLQTESESVVLPLHNRAVCFVLSLRTFIIIPRNSKKSTPFLKFFRFFLRILKKPLFKPFSAIALFTVPTFFAYLL